MGRMVIRPVRILIIFLNLIFQSVHGIFRCLFSSGMPEVHVSDQPFSADHVWNDDPCGCSPVGNTSVFPRTTVTDHREGIGYSRREQSDPAPFAHEPGPVSGNADCPAGFP